MSRSARPAPPWALLSLMLRYPEDIPPGAVEAGVAELPREAPTRAPLERFLAGWDADPATYVATFDLRRRASLELTYYRYGDTRERGPALLRIKKLYRAAGLPLDSAQLPDHLTVMLAFAALAPDGYGAALLAEHLPALELLRRSLHDLDSPYASVLDAVMTGLPPLDVAEQAEVVKLAREGPPEEAVGLEPYGPPEAMPLEARP